MLEEAKKRGFHTECVLFDSWYTSIENLKRVRSLTLHWFTRLKSNWLVNPDDTFNRPVFEVEIPPKGRVVHLRQYGFIRVLWVEKGDGELEY